MSGKLNKKQQVKVDYFFGDKLIKNSNNFINSNFG